MTNDILEEFGKLLSKEKRTRKPKAKSKPKAGIPRYTPPPTPEDQRRKFLLHPKSRRPIALRLIWTRTRCTSCGEEYTCPWEAGLYAEIAVPNRLKNPYTILIPWTGLSHTEQQAALLTPRRVEYRDRTTPTCPACLPRTAAPGTPLALPRPAGWTYEEEPSITSLFDDPDELTFIEELN